MPYLDTSMTAQVEIKLGRMCDSDIDGGSWWDVARLAHLVLLVGTEETCVVTFLDHDERDAWLEVHLQLQTRLAHCTQLMVQHLPDTNG